MISACKKSDFLNTIPDNSLKVPTTLTDCQDLLDNDRIMNGTNGLGLVPNLTLVGSDEVYLRPINYNSVTPLALAQYKWADDAFLGNSIADWDFPYRAVFYANQVLELLEKMENKNEAGFNNVKGQALFHRAFMFYNLAQVFAPQYKSGSASTDLGIPLRLRADINEKLSRSTVQQTYDRIIADLTAAESLLPDTALYKTRASKVAVYALLARTYLNMQEYDKALVYADKSIQIKNGLMDFNTEQIKRFNKEVIFHSIGISYRFFNVDTTLYKSYDSNDLRKTKYVSVFSGPYWYFSGSYEPNGSLFFGLATDEMYLTRAECYARKSDVTNALKDLNFLLRNRFKASSFVDRVAVSGSEALALILGERKKELLFRGLRWTDLRRLNDEGRNITLTRNINGQVITLPPNSLKYTWPIPSDVISFNPGMKQNPR
jgi:tetratricopeptide (TPR) repeat protein